MVHFTSYDGILYAYGLPGNETASVSPPERPGPEGGLISFGTVWMIKP